MAIEDSLEKIAFALERIAEAQEENTRINDWYKKHLVAMDAIRAGQYGDPAAEAVQRGHLVDVPEAEAVAPMDTAELPDGLAWNGPAVPAASEPEKELTFEELKAFLHARGYDFPKGTKRTTLLKAWEAHKDEPVKAAEPSPVEPPPLDVDPVGYAPSITAPEAPVVEEKKPMTREEAMDRIRKSYAATEEDKADFIEALASVGAKMFQEVQDGKFDALVAKYEELKNARA